MPRAADPIAIVRSPGFDCFGARTTKRVYARCAGFDVETVREFYNRDGGRDDYETETASFPTLNAALAATGAPIPAERVAA